MGTDADPLTTATPFTVTVALLLWVKGVNVMLLVALLTKAVYETVPGAKTGVKVPELRMIFERLALTDRLVTITV